MFDTTKMKGEKKATEHSIKSLNSGQIVWMQWVQYRLQSTKAILKTLLLLLLSLSQQEDFA